MSEQFDFEVHAPDIDRQSAFVATVRIPIGKRGDESQVLHYIRSIQLKNDFMNKWVRDNASGYGVEIRGGPRPVFTRAGERESGVSAYEQDFRLTRPL